MSGYLAKLRGRLNIDNWDTSRKLIALCAAGMLILLLWGSFARLDEITRGLGKVVLHDVRGMTDLLTALGITAAQPAGSSIRL